MGSKIRGIVLILALLLFLFTGTAVWALTVTDVAKEFICNCGCQKMLDVCDMTCGAQLRGLIGEKIAAGWDKPKIMSYLVTQYGEKVLAAPTKKGFNLTAWIMPFVALLLGAFFVYMVVARWVKQQDLPEEKAVTEQVGRAALDPKYEHKLDEELKKFEF